MSVYHKRVCRRRLRNIGADGGLRLRKSYDVTVTHADQALALLTDPIELEVHTLGAFGYSDNETVLHRDDSVLSKAESARCPSSRE